MKVQFSPESPVEHGTPRASPWGRFAALLSLSAFAVAQPLYVRMSTQTPFFLDSGTTPARLILLTVAILLVPPVILWSLEELLGLVRSSWGRGLHRLFIGVLTGLLLLQVGTQLARQLSLGALGLRGFSAAVIAVGGTIAALRWYDRRWMQRLLGIAAWGVLLFPLQFLRSGAAVTVLSPVEMPAAAAVQLRHPAPVVVIIFDEFSGMTLLDQERQIDAVRYPNFSRLARTATWYRNASTVHARTNYAVPAILTGRLPLADREVTLAEAPQNLFTLLHGAGYPTVAFEPVSRLCPESVGDTPGTDSIGAWAWVMADCLTRVYLSGIVPKELPIRPPRIPLVWYGDNRDSALDLGQRTGISRDASDADEQFERFRATLPRSGEHRLSVLHAMTPHAPWVHLPTGAAYVKATDVAVAACGGMGPIGEDWTDDPLLVDQAWQRYLLQVGDADRRLGLILDQLEANRVFDDCLVVVAGDHGVSFHPGHSRRVPDGANLNDVLSVPLFIKLPGQREGQVSDRNVESIDIFPTIADALGADLPLSVDGDSLLAEEAPPRPRKSIQFDGGSTVVDAAFPARYEALDRMLERFGSGTADDRLRLPLGTHSELAGRRVNEFILLEPGNLRLNVWGTPPELAGRGACYLEVSVAAPRPVSEPLKFAVAMNGLIVGVVQTSTDPDMAGIGCCLVLDPPLPAHRGSVEIYRIQPGAGSLELEPCKLVVRNDGN